jgi:ribosomal protein S7
LKKKSLTNKSQSTYNTILKKLYLLVRSNLIRNKAFNLLIEKRILTFIFKNRYNLKTNYQRYLYKKLVRSYIKQTRSSINSHYFYFLNKSIKDKSQSKTEIKSLLHSKLVGIFLKNGKKVTSLNIINKALLLTALKLKRSPALILSQVFNKLKTSVELKEVKIRKSIHLVPFPVNFKRKIFLLVKWLRIGTLKSNKKIKTLILKLHKELVKTLKTKYSLSYRIKKYHISKALLNKSNFHFRW